MPTSASSIALSIVNGDGTVNMAPNGAAVSTATASFASAGSTSTTAAIANATTSVTLTGVTGTGTGTITVTGSVSSVGGQSLTVGAVTYSFGTTCSAVNCIVIDTTSTTDQAENIEAVINATTGQCASNSTGCVFSGQTANSEVVATQSGAVVTVTNYYYTGVGLSSSVSFGTNRISVSTSSIAQGSTSGCTSLTAGDFIIGISAAASATNLYNALAGTSCVTTNKIGVTVSGLVGSGFNITDTALGYATFAGTNGLTLTGTAGSNGTDNACGTPTAGTFLLAPASTLPTTSTVAARLAAAVNMCTNSGVGAGHVTANAFTVTNTVLGYSTFAGANGYRDGQRNVRGNQRDDCVHLPPPAPLLWPPVAPCPPRRWTIAQLKTALADCGCRDRGYRRHGSRQLASGYRQFTRVMTPASRRELDSNRHVLVGRASLMGATGRPMPARTPTAGTFLLAPCQHTAHHLDRGGRTGRRRQSVHQLGGWRRYSNRQRVHGDRHCPRLFNLRRFDGYRDGERNVRGNQRDDCVHLPHRAPLLWPPRGTMPTTALEIAQLKTALTDCGAGTGVTGGTVAGSSLPVTDNSLGYDTSLTRYLDSNRHVLVGRRHLWEQRDGQCLRAPPPLAPFSSPRQHPTHHLDRGRRTGRRPRSVHHHSGVGTLLQ